MLNEQTLPLLDRLRRIKRPVRAKQLADELGVSPAEVYRRAACGELPAIRLGGCVRFDGPSVARFLEGK